MSVVVFLKKAVMLIEKKPLPRLARRFLEQRGAQRALGVSQSQHDGQRLEQQRLPACPELDGIVPTPWTRANTQRRSIGANSKVPQRWVGDLDDDESLWGNRLCCEHQMWSRRF
jgi:hypothetical protein